MVKDPISNETGGKTMYYVFSNWKSLRELSKEKKVDQLAEEFKKTEMIKISGYQDVNPSAKETYRYMCQDIADINEDALVLIHKHAIKMFVDKREIMALVMISENPRLFGSLEGEAFEIVKAYNDAKRIAIEFFKEKSYRKNSVAPFNEEVKSVKVKYNSGRLTFEFEGEEFTVFYGL